MRQTRSEARDAAFTQVFQMDLHEDDMDIIMDELLRARPECRKNLAYIQAVIDGVKERRGEIDELIKKHLRSGWSFSRISKMSRIILEIAVFEMKYMDDVPARAAINEAVELAKKYGDDRDPVFVNGLLANVYKELNDNDNSSGI